MSDPATRRSPAAGSAGQATGDSLCVGPHPDLAAVEWSEASARLLLTGGLETSLAWRLPETGALLRRLFGEGLSRAAWSEAAAAAPDQGAEAEALLDRLRRGRLLLWWYGAPGRRLLLAEPLRGSFAPASPAEPVDATWRLSEKALLLLAREAPRLVDPLVEAQIVVPGAGLPLLPALAALARRAPAASPPPEGLPGGLPDGLTEFLACCGFLHPDGAVSAFAEAWTPAEWLFQRQTGFGTGGRFEFATTGARDVPPAGPRPRAPEATRIALPQPVERPSSPFAELMERRRSLRRPGSRPPALPDLGALLWSVARRRSDREQAMEGDMVLRNVPAGGALGELEFYLAVNRCSGLERGLHFYDGLAHALAPVAAPDATFEAMMQDAAERLFLENARPDCLVILSSRLARLSQKYRGGALRLSLLHVGLVFEALYLGATDLGLSPCANGFVDQAFFAALTGLDPFEELALGQFALSGPPD
ncbi:SagB-type dehydrogenase domain-containing protein [Tistlia consotensis]|uniref:SagB-type dehydrogenase domain-containing protein n=1 Tax=Tistlia consotensis USBA 355 TaxID=560819 RepID=A0A1Y6BNK4_9PROT|nr:SagB family peptide dehydrogenase [Tistlia consotensis]SMF12058.1 SagB-type dehydrogenase domain-containing protein [Tistlia consotensis USBA 355]SNR51393.1 SagB-type dehydrogenase domain-containing protein [Tistlia consotensis]